MKKIFAILCCAFCFTSCTHQEQITTDQSNTDSSIKISVMQSGKILVDGQNITIPELDKRLAQLKVENGTVWYYRESGEDEPPSEAMEVMKLIIEHKLPITLSTKPDFSDSVGPDGQIHTRKP